MRPRIELDGAAMRANVAAFAALGAPVAAVVKAGGYGWGVERLVRELDGVVDSYVVADDEELAALRPLTARPARLLADAPPGRLERVLELGGVPNVSTREALEEALALARRRGGLTIRVGILDAAGWSAISPDEIGEFAAACAAGPVRVELWTHQASARRAPALLEALETARACFTAAGVPVVSLDADSTAVASRSTALARLRIGAGLFGATLGAPLELRCAIRVSAPVVRRYPPGALAWAGYGDTRVPSERPVAVLRCGYGDGFPKGLAGSADILAVGMQYTTRLDGSQAGESVVLIGASSDLDALSSQAGMSPHELITGLAPR